MPIEFAEGSEVLPPGRHPATVLDIEQGLVDNFPESATRRPIFDEWQSLLRAMVEVAPVKEAWLDGSYVTRKIDPSDIDLFSLVDGPAYEALDIQPVPIREIGTRFSEPIGKAIQRATLSSETNA